MNGGKHDGTAAYADRLVDSVEAVQAFAASAVLDRHHCRCRFLCQGADSASRIIDWRHHWLGCFSRLMAISRQNQS